MGHRLHLQGEAGGALHTSGLTTIDLQPVCISQDGKKAFTEDVNCRMRWGESDDKNGAADKNNHPKWPHLDSVRHQWENGY